ncbi:polysaccharide lyase [Cellvibrio sp. ARAG 10.3]|uniref:polysaccharide lyase n=1 Tax=Cellvibrio sp. ARAG 10.3 TaxID=3451358 RepID=UPI003F448C1D
MSFIRYVFIGAALMLANQVAAYNCTNLPSYSVSTVATGQLVKHQNHAYHCDVGGWCSQGGPYEPGVGWAWTYAWSDLGACDAGGSSSTSSSSVTPSSSFSSSSLNMSSSAPSSVSSSSSSSSSSLSSSSASSNSSTGGAPLYFNDFNQHATGAYTAAQFNADWGFNPNASAGVADNRLHILNDPEGGNNKVLRVTYRQGQVGGGSASVFTYTIPGAPHNQLWLQYKVMFDENFTWVKGGKLPGLAGYTGTKPTGCVANNLLNGFSARLMWRENGHALQYLYNPNKTEYCGDYSSYYFFFTKGRWHTITSHVELGSVNQHDGRITTYIDGEAVLVSSNLLLRTSAQVTIDKLLFETFFGGSSNDWAPATDQYSYFDNITISTTSRLGDVTTQPNGGNQGGPHPLAGYSQWQSAGSYSSGSRVYVQDSEGFYHYYAARYGIAPNKNPLQHSLPENYVGIYSPVRLDNSEPWVELIDP